MLALVLILALPATSFSQALCRGFLPPNPYWISDGPRPSRGLSEGEFNEILDEIEREYALDFAAHGARLKVSRRWQDGRVNAYAYRQGTDWVIEMYGGMARYPSMTRAGYLSVACHEIGHHLGGAPKFGDEVWASVEGQADYYATLKCLRRLFQRQRSTREVIDETALRLCALEHGTSAEDQAVCVESAMAGVDMAEVLALLDNTSRWPRLDSPDRRRVVRTYELHPRAQCRLDTYFQGALCRTSLGEELSNDDPAPGTCMEPSATARGVRPRCWFAP